MKLDYPFLQLPLHFDADVLAQEIEALGEAAWRPHPQGYAGNSALPLVSVDGDPTSDAVRGRMQPTPQLLACPYLMQAMENIGAVWGRSRLMRLSGQAEVKSHVDINYYWREHMRVHVPIVTQPTVQFHCGDAVLNMAAGECWIFDTWRLHRVHNDDHRSRIHLVADTVGGHGFWQAMRRSRSHDQNVSGWQAQHVRAGGEKPVLDYESFNLPAVMSPWEVREHLSFLMSETRPAEALRAFAQSMVGPFALEWHALWAKYGDTGEGLMEYRALRDAFRAQLPRFDRLVLNNGVLLVKAVAAIVTSNLIAEGANDDVEVRDRTAEATAVAALSTQSQPPATPAVVPAKATPVATRAVTRRFDRPIIVLSAPRSGSTLLFETLARAPGLFTTGRESHRMIEGLSGLHPSDHDYDSNRLLAADATPTVTAGLLKSFGDALRNRHGTPAPESAIRALEKTPKNALRVPFLQEIFPDAHFVFLYREPQEVLASMIEAWHSGRFRMYPDLPGWIGPDWSLLLVPGWRELSGKPIEDIVARQWATTLDILLDDLDTIPPDRLVGIRYDDFLARPQDEIVRLCSRLDLEWDTKLDTLPLSRHTLTPPDPDKWRKHEASLARIMPTIAATMARAEHYLCTLTELDALGPSLNMQSKRVH